MCTHQIHGCLGPQECYIVPNIEKMAKNLNSSNLDFRGQYCTHDFLSNVLQPMFLSCIISMMATYWLKIANFSHRSQATLVALSLGFYQCLVQKLKFRESGLDKTPAIMNDGETDTRHQKNSSCINICPEGRPERNCVRIYQPLCGVWIHWTGVPSSTRESRAPGPNWI